MVGLQRKVLDGDCGEKIYLLCAGPALSYEMTATEAKSLADDLLQICAEANLSAPE